MDKEKAVRLVQPIVAVLFAWLVVLLIIISGVVVSVRIECWTVFSRCGSLIVVAALLLALFDQSGWAKGFLNLVSSIKKEENGDTLKEIIKRDIVDGLEKYNLSKTKNEIDFLVDQALKSYTTNFPLRFGGALKGMMLKHEMAIGACGTFIWGFGDAIGDLVVQYTC